LKLGANEEEAAACCEVVDEMEGDESEMVADAGV
jgi:hypothetical protein